MQIWFEDNEIKVKNEDVEFYRKLEEKAYNKILSESEIKRFTFWKVIVTIILLFFWIIPGILNILYIFSKKHARHMAINEASEDFYIEKIDNIPFYSSVHGITVLENLGSVNEDSEIAAVIKAYNKGANAIINLGHHAVAHSDTKSDLIGKGVHTTTSTTHYITGDLAIIKTNSLNVECMKKSNFNFQGWEKTSIQEFGYLLRMVSQSKYDIIDEDNIEAIANDYEILIKSIDDELAKPEPREKVSKETAIANLVNLKNIIISIKKYIDCINTNK